MGPAVEAAAVRGERWRQILEKYRQNGSFMHEDIDIISSESTGCSLVAKAPISKGENIAHIQPELFLHAASQRFFKFDPKLNGLQKLAVYLCMRRSGLEPLSVATTHDLILHQKHTESLLDEYLDIMPTMDEFRANMPFFWNEDFVENFCDSFTKDLIQKQRTKADRDIKIVREEWDRLQIAKYGEVRQKLDYDLFLWAWFCIITRSIYAAWVPPALDQMGCNVMMLPIGDVMNHSSVGEDHTMILFSRDKGVSVTARKDYAVGEEIFLRYEEMGSHNLLVDYGFIPDQSDFQEIGIERDLSPLFSENQRQFLQIKGYWHNWRISSASISFRIEVALRTLMIPDEVFEDEESTRRIEDMIEGFYDGAQEQPAVDKFFLDLLQNWHKQCEVKLLKIEEAETEKAVDDHLHGKDDDSGYLLALQRLKRLWNLRKDLLQEHIHEMKLSIIVNGTGNKPMEASNCAGNATVA